MNTATNKTKSEFTKRFGNVIYVRTPISVKAIAALTKLGFVVVIRK